MASNTLIGEWATGFWQDLGEPSNVSALNISGYAVQVNTLGTLNARLGTCFSGVSGVGGGFYDASPDYTYAELSIVGLFYEIGWYNQLARANMGMSQDTLAWTNKSICSIHSFVPILDVVEACRFKS